MVEWTSSRLHATNALDRLNSLQADTGIFARRLRDEFKKLEPDIQTLCSVEIEGIMELLRTVDVLFVSAKTKCQIVANEKSPK